METALTTSPQYPRLITVVEKRENNLNAIRLFLASLVLFSHSYLLSGGVRSLGLGDGQKANYKYYCGSVAVDLFFFLSGFLITASWIRAKTMSEYLRKRVLRIYPGFIGAVLFGTIIITVVNPKLIKVEASAHWLWEFIQNCFWLSSASQTGSLVFPNNPWPNDVNGSLWTIPKEFECYLSVCAIGIFALFKFRRFILGIFIFTYLLFCRGILRGDGTLEWAASERRLFTYFLAGMCAWLWRDKIPFRASIAFCFLGFISLVMWTHGPWLCVEPFAFTYLILWLGYAKPLKATRWCDSTDLSYGAYLYACPIQQLLAAQSWGCNAKALFFLAAPLTLGTAFLSWHLIEKPFLNLKSSKFTDHDPATRRSKAPTDVQLTEAF